ncbi:MAG: electron transport complex subunit RsxC, partial [Porticoccus sp.]
MRKVWDLIGGIHPPENKHQSVQSSIGTLPMPKALVIPLSQHIGAPPKLLVAEGEHVLKGQVLAEPKGFVSVGIHAPTSGVISAISDHPIPHPSGMAARCLTLIPDGEDQWVATKGIENYRERSPEELLNIIRQSGIAGMGGAGFPSAVKLGPRQPISTLIINGTECEPYITADDMLMRERPQEIVEGIKILSYILGEPEEILIGIEDNKPEAYEALEPYLKDTNIELVEFQTRYPSGGEKQLIQVLTGKEVPNGGLPADVGIVCQNIGTTHAIKRAIQQGEPLISRVTTVTGKACQTNRNYQVLIGTPISHLLEHNGFDANQCPRLVMGGP